MSIPGLTSSHLEISISAKVDVRNECGLSEMVCKAFLSRNFEQSDNMEGCPAYRRCPGNYLKVKRG